MKNGENTKNLKIKVYVFSPLKENVERLFLSSTVTVGKVKSDYFLLM